MRRPHTGRRLSISGRKYYRHVHRGQAIDLFRVIANRLSLSLSLSRGDCQKKQTEKAWKSDGCTGWHMSDRDATLSGNRILRRCRSNGNKRKKVGGTPRGNPLLSSPNPHCPLISRLTSRLGVNCSTGKQHSHAGEEGLVPREFFKNFLSLSQLVIVPRYCIHSFTIVRLKIDVFIERIMVFYNPFPSFKFPFFRN